MPMHLARHGYDDGRLQNQATNVQAGERPRLDNHVAGATVIETRPGRVCRAATSLRTSPRIPRRLPVLLLTPRQGCKS